MGAWLPEKTKVPGSRKKQRYLAHEVCLAPFLNIIYHKKIIIIRI